jgi:hypothetical protein
MITFAEKIRGSMKEYYSLPLLFEKFHLAKGVVELMNNHPYIFRDNVVIESFYGSNGGKLCGGRNSIPSKYSEKEVADFVESNGITPVVVMSNLLIEPKDIPDENATRITKAFAHKKLMFCVGNRNIEDWLENTCFYNRGQFILSTTQCLDLQQTKSNTDIYKKIVLSERYINDWKSLRTLSDRTRSKLEIVVNLSCPTDCEMRRKHYEFISGLALGGEPLKNGYPCCNECYGGYGQLHEILSLPSFVTLDKIGAYLNLGINHFKIEGRANFDYVLIETMAYFLVKPEYQLMFRDTLNHLNR